MVRNEVEIGPKGRQKAKNGCAAWDSNLILIMATWHDNVFDGIHRELIILKALTFGHSFPAAELDLSEAPLFWRCSQEFVAVPKPRANDNVLVVPYTWKARSHLKMKKKLPKKLNASLSALVVSSVASAFPVATASALAVVSAAVSGAVMDYAARIAHAIAQSVVQLRRISATIPKEAKEAKERTRTRRELGEGLVRFGPKGR